MPRMPRKKSSTGIYHIMMRGVDRQNLFLCDADRAFFINTLFKVKQTSDFLLFAYCLMDNHVHLLMQVQNESLDHIMKRLGVTYAGYFNWKYQIQGHVFQDRFRSECVETDSYFLDVVRYICQNPVKAGLCGSPSDYAWLDFGRLKQDRPLVDSISRFTHFANESDLYQFISQPGHVECLEDNGRKRLTDQEANKKLCLLWKCDHAADIASWDKAQRDNAIKCALSQGISVRQLARLTLISKTAIERSNHGKR